jgi:dienelactone hydrolase
MRTLLLGALLLSFSASAASPGPIPVTIQDGKQSFKGDLYLPNAVEGSIPLVVVIHEWWGKTEYPKMRARKIADELGFAALAVDLYGDGKSVATPPEAQTLASEFYQKPEIAVRRLNAFVAAVPAALKKRSKGGASIDSARFAAIGYCFGGTQALNLARASASGQSSKPIAVVAVHAGLESALKVAGKIDTKILVLTGEADPMVPKSQVEKFQEEMKAAQADVKVIGYPGATHAFSNPKATEIGKKYKMPIAYDKKADEESWKETTAFLKANLVPNEIPAAK